MAFTYDSSLTFESNISPLIRSRTSLLSLQPLCSLKSGHLLEYLTGTQRIRYHRHHSVHVYNFPWQFRNMYTIQHIMFSCSPLILPMRFWHILQPNQIQDGAMLNASHWELDRFIALFLRLFGQYLIWSCQTDLILNFGIQTSFTQIVLHISRVGA